MSFFSDFLCGNFPDRGEPPRQNAIEFEFPCVYGPSQSKKFMHKFLRFVLNFSEDSMSEVIFSIQRSQIRLGVNFVNSRKIILYWDGNSTFKATRNRCKHQGGKFLAPEVKDSCVVRCPNHDWKLNVASMLFENPAGGLRADELLVELVGDRIEIVDSDSSVFNELRVAANLTPGELELKFYAHACMMIRGGGISTFHRSLARGACFRFRVVVAASAP